MTSVYSDYTKLSSYLEGQQFGPKSSVPTPSMNYPILPKYNVSYGLNTLTHDSDPYTGYYNIESGYGQNPTSCTGFMVGSCPSNAYVQPFTPPILKERFQMATKDPKELAAKLKDLKLIMFTQDGCKFCKDALDDLNLKKMCPNVKILNLKNKANLKLFKDYNGMAVPMFVSEKTKQTFTGKPSSLELLVDKLGGDNGKDIKSAVKDLDVHVLVSDRCGYCKKLKNMLDANGVSEVITFYKDSDPSANQVFGRFSFDGVPFILSKKTGKHITGAPQSLQQILASLY